MTSKSIGIDADVNPAFKALMMFGLADHYTWLPEDYPRQDEAAWRPFPYEEDLPGEPALPALPGALGAAPIGQSIWRSQRR